MPSKLWIASKGASPLGASDEEHAYLIYDPDGDPNTNDEYVFRGGPENNNPLNLGRIAIENWVPIDLSEDNLDGNDPFEDRNYTEVNTGVKTPEQVRDEIANWARELGNENPETNKIISNVPYTLPIQINDDGDADWSPALNSNTTVKSALVNSGIEFNANTPKAGGSGEPFSPVYFPGSESFYTGSDGVYEVSPGSGDAVIYGTGGDNDYKISPNPFDDSTIHILEGGNSETQDTLTFNGVDPEDIRYERDLNGDLKIYFPWDGANDPSVVIHDQFIDSENPGIDGIWVEPQDGGAPTFIPLSDPSNVPLFLGPPPFWVPDILAPLFGDAPGIGPIGIQGGGDPLVLDLDGNGQIDLVSLENSAAFFDFWGDGYARHTGWVAPSDGFLTIDLNGNGTIDEQSELFSADSPLGYLTDSNWTAFQNEENGFAKLAAYDSNDDGIIDALDDVWTELKIWQDVNGDGISQAEELFTLDTFGITSFDISNYEFDSFQGILGGGFTREAEGNTITHHSTFTLADGSVREIVDVWFDTDYQNTYFRDDYTLDVRTLFLPTLRGYGQLSDLHIAMSMDNAAGGLLDKVADFAISHDFNNLFDDFAVVRSDVEDIMFTWAGIDADAVRASKDYSDHGLFGQMPEFFFLRKFLGVDSDFLGTWLDQSPYMPNASSGVEALTDLWQNLVDVYAARIIFQSGGSELFADGASYNPALDVFEGTIDLSQTAIDQLEITASSHSDAGGFWNAVAGFIDGTKGITELTSGEVSMLDTAISTSTSGALSWADVIATLEDNIMNAQNGGDTVNGTQWDDVIYGGDGDDTLIGGAGDDELFGVGYGNDATNDILIGGLGNDIYHDGWGDDIFQYDYGDDVIVHDGGTSYLSHDIIRFGTGIAVEDVSLNIAKMIGNFSTWHVVFDVEGRGSIALQIQGYGTEDTELIDELHFEDGSIIDVQNLLASFHGDAQDNDITALNWNSLGDKALYGYEGNDILYANVANSTQKVFLDGGEGDDVLHGGLGNDTFFFSGGNDQIYVSNGGSDKILLPEGYTLDDLSFFRYTDLSAYSPNTSVQHDALIIVDGLGSISIRGQLGGDPNYLVETLEFSDGSSISLLNQTYKVLGTDGDDYLTSAYNWPDQDDVYLVSPGNDTIAEGSGIDTLSYGEGISFEDLTLYRPASSSSSFTETSNLIIADNAGNSVQVYLHFYGPQSTIDTLLFADGSSVNLADLEIETRGTSGHDVIGGVDTGDASPDDTIFSYGGDDQIRAGIGDDIVYAGSGNDYIDDGDGNDQLYGEAGSDEIHGRTGDDTLDGGEGNDSLDGGSGNDTLIGGAGSDTLDGGADDDLLIYNYSDNLGVGDIYEGGHGEDTLRINISTGNYSQPLYQDFQNFLSFAAQNYNLNSGNGAGYDFEYLGLTVSDIENLEVYVDGVLTSSAPATTQQAPTAFDDVFYAQQNQTVSGNVLDNNGYGKDIDFNGDTLSVFAETVTTAQGGSVTINADGSFVYTSTANFLGTDSFTYTLSDGTENDTGQATINMFADAIVLGGATNDLISASSADEVIIGGRGDDSLYGYQGNDTYVYNLGDGNDVITDSNGTDQIIMGAGIGLEDLKFFLDGQDLEIFLGEDILRIEYQTYSTNVIESILFDNGVVLDLTQNLTLTDVNNTSQLTGMDNSNDTLIGGSGDDYLYDIGGDDSYVWSMGDGSDTIVDLEGSDTLYLKNVDPENVFFSQGFGTNLEVHIGSEIIEIENHFNGQAVENIVFDNGETFAIDRNLTFTDVTNSNSVDGLDDSDDLLVGGAGDDYLYGRGGNDTYIWNLGDGNDTINDYDGFDKIVLGEGLTPQNVTFFRQFNYKDLLIKVGLQTITVQNHYVSNGLGAPIEELVFSDGLKIDLTQGVIFTGNVWADDGFDSLKGTIYADTLYALAGDDVVYGYEGNDLISGDEGDDYIDGGADFDIAVYEGNYEDYTITDQGSYLTVADNVGNEGADDLYNIERLNFANGIFENGSFFSGSFNGSIFVPDAWTIETESGSLTLNNYVIRTGFSQPSGGGFVEINGSTGNDGSIGITFDGPAYTYDFDITYFDETDGAGSYELQLNGVVIDSWLSDGTHGGAGVEVEGLTTRTISSLDLETGDHLELFATRHSGEAARVDAFRFRPEIFSVPDTMTVEAESDASVTLNNYDIRTGISQASGGGFVEISGATGNDGSIGITFDGQSYTYDFDITYFDENDGTASYELQLNGVEIDSWVSDGTHGGAGIEAQGLTTRTIENLNLATGDYLELFATRQGGEAARVDAFRFRPETAIYQVDFETGSSGFAYSDDAFFGTDAPGYASGQYVNNALEITLGGQDEADIFGMSGGWTGRFNVGQDTASKVSFDYVLDLSSAYETNEYIDLMLAIDGNIVGIGDESYITRVYGTAPNPSSIVSGTASFDIGKLADGAHTITIGAYGNQKTATNESATITIDNLRLDLAPDTDYPTIDFTDMDFLVYGTGNENGTITAENGGASVHLAGNVWKAIDFDYTVTADTILEFEFMTTSQGEIHAIGLNDTGNTNINHTFQLYGTQSWGIADYNNYAGQEGQWVKYTINVGDFYTGAFDRIFFANDHDIASPTAESYFRNISVYEAGTQVLKTIHGSEGADELTGTDANELLYGNDGLDTLIGGAGADTFAFNETALNDVDIIGDFNASEGDVIDIAELLTGYDPLTDALTDFVQITDNGTDSFVGVDIDGGADAFVQIATILGVTGLTDEDALESAGTLIAA